jgi:hypothetical protein
MTVAAPGFIRRDARPPIEMEVAPAPGAAAVPRPTVVPRRWIEPLLGIDPGVGHHPSDPAVRRFWTAVIGPGAVADLLRLIAAARDGRVVREPIHLTVLVAEGLVERRAATVSVSPRVPHLGEKQLCRLRPRLRAEYRMLLAEAAAGGGR